MELNEFLAASDPRPHMQAWSRKNIEKKLPHGATNPRIVLGYNNEIRLMVDTQNNEKWTAEDFKLLEHLKVEYLKMFLGYEIEPLSNTISHDDYEKNFKDLTDNEKVDT